MIKNHMIRFLVDEQQFNRIKNNSSAKGFKSISAYIRDLSLNKDIRFESMILEIHREVVDNGRQATCSRDSGMDSYCKKRVGEAK